MTFKNTCMFNKDKCLKNNSILKELPTGVCISLALILATLNALLREPFLGQPSKGWVFWKSMWVCVCRVCVCVYPGVCKSHCTLILCPLLNHVLNMNYLFNAEVKKSHILTLNLRHWVGRLQLSERHALYVKPGPEDLERRRDSRLARDFVLCRTWVSFQIKGWVGEMRNASNQRC